jgi:hypothetical protein
MTVAARDFDRSAGSVIRTAAATMLVVRMKDFHRAAPPHKLPSARRAED